MVKSPQEAYRKGYADGLRMAKKLRWQGTFIGNLLRSANYRPGRNYRAEYAEGFKQAMDDTSVVDWKPPQSPGE
jgi:hypothetical protein